MKKLVTFILILTSNYAMAAYAPPFIFLRSISTSQKACEFELENINRDFAIEWQFSDSDPYWTVSASSSGQQICENATSCLVKYAKGQFVKNRPYYFNARQFIDDNDNGRRDAGEFFREWSPVLILKNNDYIHRCTFR